MSYIRKTRGLVVAALLGVTVLVVIAIWQFYLFVSFKGMNGLLDSQGGETHLWIAIVAAVLACLASFFIFSIFMRYDRDDEIHITAPPQRRNAVGSTDK